MHYFKVYGAQRTGTNYTVALLDLNFKNIKILMNIGGWKHQEIILYPKDEEIFNKKVFKKTIEENKDNLNNLKKLFNDNKVIFIVCVKNPYTWLVSYFKYYDIKINKKEIIYAVKLWNKLYGNYKKHIKSGKAFLVVYEEVLYDYKLFLEKARHKFKLIKKHKDYINIEKRMKANNDYTLGGVKEDNFIKKDFYLNPNVEELFKPEQLKTINQFLDKKLVSFYGYEVYKFN